jgi:hypothetical protein
VVGKDPDGQMCVAETGYLPIPQPQEERRDTTEAAADEAAAADAVIVSEEAVPSATDASIDTFRDTDNGTSASPSASPMYCVRMFQPPNDHDQGTAGRSLESLLCSKDKAALAKAVRQRNRYGPPVRTPEEPVPSATNTVTQIVPPHTTTQQTAMTSTPVVPPPDATASAASQLNPLYQKIQSLQFDAHTGASMLARNQLDAEYTRAVTQRQEWTKEKLPSEMQMDKQLWADSLYGAKNAPRWGMFEPANGPVNNRNLDGASLLDVYKMDVGSILPTDSLGGSGTRVRGWRNV